MTKEHPIILSTPMVKAILDGRKTQTRRPIKPQPKDTWSEFMPVITTGWSTDLWNFYNPNSFDDCGDIKCPYGQVGDRLWVRETFCYKVDPNTEEVCHNEYWYRATDPDIVKIDTENQCETSPWKPSIHMPRWASRIDLEITEIRAERLQDITPSDAVAEGALPYNLHGWLKEVSDFNFQLLWDSINGKKYPWDSNCWVWVISFKKEEG